MKFQTLFAIKEINHLPDIILHDLDLFIYLKMYVIIIIIFLLEEFYLFLFRFLV